MIDIIIIIISNLDLIIYIIELKNFYFVKENFLNENLIFLSRTVVFVQSRPGCIFSGNFLPQYNPCILPVRLTPRDLDPETFQSSHLRCLW